MHLLDTCEFESKSPIKAGKIEYVTDPRCSTTVPTTHKSTRTAGPSRIANWVISFCDLQITLTVLKLIFPEVSRETFFYFSC